MRPTGDSGGHRCGAAHLEPVRDDRRHELEAGETPSDERVSRRPDARSGEIALDTLLVLARKQAGEVAAPRTSRPHDPAETGVC